MSENRYIEKDWGDVRFGSIIKYKNGDHYIFISGDTFIPLNKNYDYIPVSKKRVKDTVEVLVIDGFKETSWLHIAQVLCGESKDSGVVEQKPKTKTTRPITRKSRILRGTIITPTTFGLA